EIGRGEGVGGVLQRGHRLVGARGGVVDRGDVDGDLVGGRVEVGAAVQGAAVVLHLEGEGGVAGAVGVAGRLELELAGGDVGGRDGVAGQDRGPVELEGAGGRQGGDRDRTVVAYAALFRSEIGRGEGVGGVLQRGHR